MPEILALEIQLTETSVLALKRTSGRFNLVVGDQEFDQTTCEFLLTFACVQEKNIEEYVSNLSNEYDYVRVPLSGCGKSLTLSLSDFARLRDVYCQRMFELKLEDLLMRSGISQAELLSRQTA